MTTNWPDRKLHFIAIGGAGMSGLALVCDRLGARVTGSDRAESPYLERLRAAGLEPRLGHDADAVPFRDGHVLAVVRTQRLDAGRIVQQDEGGEVG